MGKKRGKGQLRADRMYGRVGGIDVDAECVGIGGERRSLNRLWPY